jgi:hypothetical protein
LRFATSRPLWAFITMKEHGDECRRGESGNRTAEEGVAQGKYRKPG